MSTPSITILKLGDCDQLWQVLDADCDTTVEKDIASGPCTLLSASILAGDTPSEDFFLFLYDNINPTIATTEPDEVFRVPDIDGVAYREVVLFNPPKGIYFEKGLSFAGGTGDDQTGDPTVDTVVVLTLIPGEV